MSLHACRSTILLTGIPFMIAISVVLGWWLGSLADRHLGTGWVFQAAGILLGFAAAVRDITAQLRNHDGRECSGGPSSGGSRTTGGDTGDGR